MQTRAEKPTPEPGLPCYSSRMRNSSVRCASAVLGGALFLALPILSAATISSAQQQPADDGVVAASDSLSEPVSLRMKPMPPNARKVSLTVTASGDRQFRIEYLDGSSETLSPEEFAELIHANSVGRSFLFRFLNISSTAGIAWVVLGLVGQIAFAGRMVLQWILSERQGRSIVPVGFWWMSLAGASMLLSYFIWRRDIVGVLGQCTGWLIYIRNLWLIYRERWSSEEATTTPDPSPTS